MHLTAQRQSAKKHLLQRAMAAEVIKLRLPKYECWSMNRQAEVAFKLSKICLCLISQKLILSDPQIFWCWSDDQVIRTPKLYPKWMSVGRNQTYELNKIHIVLMVLTHNLKHNSTNFMPLVKGKRINTDFELY